MNEKVYKTMGRTGAFSIAMGIVVMAVGLAVGIGSVICGASLLGRRSDLMI